MSVKDVIDTIIHLKADKSGCNVVLNSNNCIHGANKVFAIITLLLTYFYSLGKYKSCRQHYITFSNLLNTLM